MLFFFSLLFYSLLWLKPKNLCLKYHRRVKIHQKKCYVWCAVPLACTKHCFKTDSLLILWRSFFMIIFFYFFFSFLVTNYTGLGPHKKVKIARLLIQVKNSGYLLLYIFGFGWQWFGKYTQCWCCTQFYTLYNIFYDLLLFKRKIEVLCVLREWTREYNNALKSTQAHVAPGRKQSLANTKEKKRKSSNSTYIEDRRPKEYTSQREHSQNQCPST